MDLKAIPSADLVELENFNKLGDSWWDINGPMKPLHALKNLKVPEILNRLISFGRIKKEQIDSPKPLAGLLILDVGCGGGIQSEAFAKLGGTVVGLDLSSESIKAAKRHAELDPSLTNLTYHFQSVEEHAMHNYDKYDVVIASEVLDHVLEKEIFVENCVKCLKPGWPIFISTFSKTWDAYFYAIILGEHIFKFIPQGSHNWDKFVTPEDTAVMLQKYNCETIAVNGFVYDCFSNTFSWWNCKSASYLLEAMKEKKN